MSRGYVHEVYLLMEYVQRVHVQGVCVGVYVQGCMSREV